MSHCQYCQNSHSCFLFVSIDMVIKCHLCMCCHRFASTMYLIWTYAILPINGLPLDNYLFIFCYIAWTGDNNDTHSFDLLQWYTIQHKFLRTVYFMDFFVSIKNAKIISMKMNRQLVTWLNYACDPQILFSAKLNFNKSQNL